VAALRGQVKQNPSVRISGAAWTIKLSQWPGFGGPVSGFRPQRLVEQVLFLVKTAKLLCAKESNRARRHFTANSGSWHNLAGGWARVMRAMV
jgi:hypothetical protein